MSYKKAEKNESNYLHRIQIIEFRRDRIEPSFQPVADLMKLSCMAHSPPSAGEQRLFY